MASSDYQAWVEVLPDFSGFNNKVTNGVTSSLGNAGTAGASAFGGSFIGGVGKFAAPIVGAIAALGIGQLVGNAIGAGINYSLDSIQLAAGLAEQKNAVAVQFGDLADEIDALAKSAPKNLNLTQTAFNQLAVRFSSFAKTVAGEGGDVSAVIEELTQRGADFASVYNIEASQALELFQSGLAGETEPLRRFGLDLSAAAVAQYALTSGINDGTHELTEAEKIQARYGLLLQQTAAVQGDLANTAGSYANKQREFAVALEEAQTKFGAAILPVATKFLNIANERLLPQLSETLDKIGPQLASALESSLPSIQTLLTTIAANAPGAIQGITDGLNDIAVAAPVAIDFFTQLDTEVREADTAFRDAQTGIQEWRQAQIDAYGEVAFYGGVWHQGVETITKGAADQQREYTKVFGEEIAKVIGADKLLTGQFEGGWHRRGEILDGAERAVFQTAESIKGHLYGLGTRGHDTGRDLMLGLRDGINNNKSYAINAAGNAAAEAYGRAKAVLGIASPSKAFAELGMYSALGFAQGISGGSTDVSAAIRSMLDLPGATSPGVAGSTPDGAGSVTGRNPVDLSTTTIEELARALSPYLRNQSRDGGPTDG